MPTIESKSLGENIVRFVIQRKNMPEMTTEMALGKSIVILVKDYGRGLEIFSDLLEGLVKDTSLNMWQSLRTPLISSTILKTSLGL